MNTMTILGHFPHRYAISSCKDMGIPLWLSRHLRHYSNFTVSIRLLNSLKNIEHSDLSCVFPPSKEHESHLSSSLENKLMVRKLVLCDPQCRKDASHSNRGSSWKVRHAETDVTIDCCVGSREQEAMGDLRQGWLRTNAWGTVFIVALLLCPISPAYLWTVEALRRGWQPLRILLRFLQLV